MGSPLLATALVVGVLSFGQVVAQEVREPVPAQTTEPTQQAPPASPARASRDDGKVCHFEDVTGSRMRRRVCMTHEQFDARQHSAKQLVREMDAKPVSERIPGG